MTSAVLSSWPSGLTGRLFHLWSECTYCWQIRCCVGQKIMPLSGGPERISLETSSVALGLGSSVDFRGPGKGEQIPGGILILQSLPNALLAWYPHPVPVSLLLACSFLGHLLNHKNCPRGLPTLMLVSLCKSQSQPSENVTVAIPPHTGVLTLVSFNVLVSVPEMKV